MPPQVEPRTAQEMRAVMEEAKAAYFHEVVEPWVEKTLETILGKICDEAADCLKHASFKMGDLKGFEELSPGPDAAPSSSRDGTLPCPRGVATTYDVEDFVYDGLVAKLEGLGYDVDTSDRIAATHEHACNNSSLHVSW